MGDADVDGRARRDVVRFPHLVLAVDREETRVMAFLHGDERDARLRERLTD